MKPKEVLVGATNKIDIKLTPEGEQLKEVEVTGQAKKDKKIDLGFGGKKSFNAIGTSVNILTAKDIGPQFYKLSDLINGRFANVLITSTNLNGMPEVWIRSGHMSINYASPAIYDIDGFVYEKQLSLC